MTQKIIRQQALKARKSLSENQREQATKKITELIIESKWFKQSKLITAYIAMPGEVDLTAVIEMAWKQNKTVFLPVVIEKNQKLMFCRYTKRNSLIKDCLGMLIPNQEKNYYRDTSSFDLVLMPLVAFDYDKNRLGMGGGYYDRTFAHIKNHTILCGIAFDVQKVDKIPTNDWDVKPHQLITEKEIL